MRAKAVNKVRIQSGVTRLAAIALVAFVACAGAANAQGILGLDSPQKKHVNRAPVTTGALPKTGDEKAVSNASDGLAFCNQMEAKQLSLKSPNGKNVVQFDKCYRGRLHNVCLAKALTVMISSLQKDYDQLVQTNYPAVNSTAGVCAFTASQLANDLETARAFQARFKSLISGYDERLKCTDTTLKLLEKASFPDMPNVEQAVKTMADELKNDIAGFAKERQSADELMAKVGEAQKALEVHTDIHRAMCFTADAGPATRQ
jgi:hypothetical protein